MTYQARLDAVNANSEERSVLDSIDRPIRGLIKEINSRGIQTKFSCCGFNYDGEEEPKSHSKQGPFIVLYGPMPGNLKSYAAFHGIMQDAHSCGWTISMYHFDQRIVLWRIYYDTKNIEKDFYQQNPELGGVHDYEMSLIAIKRLEKILSSRPGKLEEYVIIDGNKGYAEALDGEWQIKPKKDYVHKNETSMQNEVRESPVRDEHANV